MTSVPQDLWTCPALRVSLEERLHDVRPVKKAGHRSTHQQAEESLHGAHLETT